MGKLSKKSFADFTMYIAKRCAFDKSLAKRALLQSDIIFGSDDFFSFSVLA